MSANLALLSSPAVLVIAGLIVVVGAFVQSGLGMGLGLTASPLLALIDPSLVPVPVLCLGVMTASAVAWSERSVIAWREAGLALFGRIAGVALATWWLAVMTDRKTFTLVFGLIVLLAVGLSVFGPRITLTRITLPLAGVISGFMGTITSVGAPPLALVYQSQPPRRSRATLAAFFALGASASLVGLFASGWSKPADAAPVLLFLPSMFIGMFLARRLKGSFDRRYRTWLLGLAGIAAVLLIAKGLS